jgi:hypothetical protein
MTTFDRIILALGATATAIAGAGTAYGMPKWATLVCIGIIAGCGAISPSVRPSKRADLPQA